MNKHLKNRLQAFNKKTEDQYSENWGSILNFVHDEPLLEPSKLEPGQKSDKNNYGMNLFIKQIH